MDTFTHLKQLIDHVEPNKPTLLSLPQELRDHIFELILVEPMRWGRRHKHDCPRCPRTSHELESPLFLDDQRSDSNHQCRCHSRSALNLLLVNHQIHAEAALTFWRMNKLCFRSMTEFNHDVGKVLRPECRKLLQHISFVDRETVFSIRQPFDKFWNTLLQCTGLRTLELSFKPTTSRLVRKDIYKYVLRMKAELPNLRSVKWIYIGSFIVSLNHPNHDFNGHHGTTGGPERDLHMAWWQTTKEVDLETLKDEEDVKRSNREFTGDFLRLVRRAMDAKILQKSPRCDLANCPRHFKYLPDGLNDRHNEAILEIEDGSVATVRFYGLPLSPETVVDNAKLRGEKEPDVLEQLST
ncbi:hypothetical protein VM1G_04316 [Cytospora mali]|uniref:F-box domain-containing protein n=1 Tax=Cytospora mali TaxID=578113 RepID=A0A194VXU0_CYTMA|nr:hypothetical protein VM1G_04316 [Valsa mali]